MAGKKTIKPVFDCTVPIVLVGMMGVGKTTIGRRLAPKLGLPFHDADEEIEHAAGMKVSDLFERHGEEYFRQGEAQVIRRLLEGPPLVLATGGGAVLNKATRQHIKKHALSIWLRAPIPTIVERASRRPTRPLLKTGDPEEIIRNLLEQRSPFYAEADCHIDSIPGPHSKTVNAIIIIIKGRMENQPNKASASLPNGTHGAGL